MIRSGFLLNDWIRTTISTSFPYQLSRRTFNKSENILTVLFCVLFIVSTSLFYPLRVFFPSRNLFLLQLASVWFLEILRKLFQLFLYRYCRLGTNFKHCLWSSVLRVRAAEYWYCCCEENRRCFYVVTRSTVSYAIYWNAEW